ncbi:protein kinase domain-containing protein [Streptomyces beigongshangae]|uniref:serine/threonine-protein kinase n=1 Tax=Streptomyces beigongshangae TaxID=2841597 RepID=UPI003D31C6D8
MAERYRLGASLGRGGMGEVWRATDEVLGRAVAVKLLLGDEADSAAAARFRLEAQTAARLSHPYVVAVFDFGLWDNRFYLVMELVEGRSLAQELTAAGSLTPERVARIAEQTAAGLAAAHRQGIVHRDIKPGNLMTDAEGTVKIGDFGIARFVDDPASALTTAGQIVGTSLYLAPERALGSPAGAASDVYSLGCVLYQLLTGEPPFRAESATITLHQHIDKAPVPPREKGVRLPPAFENYLLDLLAKQPEDRPTAQQVADWFGSGAWRGHAEPLPAPDTEHPYGPRTTSGPSYAAGTGVPHTGAGNGPATTYRLPRADGRTPRPGHAAHSAATGPTRRSDRTDGNGGAHATGGHDDGAGARPSGRSRVVGAVAAVALFVAALFVGITLFSPDDGRAGTGGPDGSSSSPSTTSPDSAEPGSGSAGPDSSAGTPETPGTQGTSQSSDAPAAPVPGASPDGAAPPSGSPSAGGTASAPRQGDEPGENEPDENEPDEEEPEE